MGFIALESGRVLCSPKMLLRLGGESGPFAVTVRPAVLSQGPEGLVIDTSRPAWKQAVQAANGPKRLSAKAVLHGAAGIVRAVTGTGGATVTMIQQRTAICCRCDKAKLSGGVFRRCGLCGCAIWGKVRNTAEHCPLNKW